MNYAAIVALIQKALDGAGLAAPQMAQTVHDIMGKLPPGATVDQINASVDQAVAEITDPTKVAAALATIGPALKQLVTTGSGPVQKSPTDLVG